MSDQNQWPKPGEQSDGQRPDASAPAPGSAAEPNGYGQDTPQQPGHQAPNPYAQQQPGQQQYGQQVPNPYAQQQPGQQQYGQQAPNPYAQQQQYGQPQQYGQQSDPYAGQQYGQQPSNPYAQQQQYGQGQYNPYAASGFQPYAQRPKTNLLAILSIVFGLGAIPLFVVAILLGPAGAILGHLALGRIRQSGEQGRGLALTGIIAGWVMTGLWLLWIIFVVVAIGNSGSYSDYGNDFGSGTGAFIG